MSRRDERNRAQDAFERDRRQNERPGEAAVKLDADPRSWNSWCPGWKGGHHERTKGAPAGSMAAFLDDQAVPPQWQCRWCWRWFDPPAPKEDR
jgi:hypothetical protein